MAKNVLSNPMIEIVLAAVVILVIASLTFAASISGALTAAMIVMVGFLGLISLLWVVKKL